MILIHTPKSKFKLKINFIFKKLWMSCEDNYKLNEERIRFLSLHKETKFCSQLDFQNSPFLKICQKNAKISESLKEKGNLSYAQGDTFSALKFFNQSLQFCPWDDSIAILFANRSAILKEKGKWDLAIQDIDLSLGNGYPDRQVRFRIRKLRLESSVYL